MPAYYWRGVQERGIPVWDRSDDWGWRAMAVEWIAAATAAGGTALIGAAATDAWQTARDGVVKLFTRGGKRRADLVRDHLDRDAAMIEAAGPGNAMGSGHGCCQSGRCGWRTCWRSSPARART